MNTYGWHHAPTHLLSADGVYMVTAATSQKAPIFQAPDQLKALQGGLLKYAAEFGWELQAWAVFPNHYHFIGSSPEKDATNLSDFLRKFHSRSALWINRQDEAKGRKVWHNFWESGLTFEKSYYARLNYVHQNAVKHGLVEVADQYPWCSARWFQRNATRAEVKKIYCFPTDRLQIEDDY